MGNILKDEGVLVQLDKERVIKFDLNSFAELEDLYGTVEAAMEALEKGSLKAVRAILWAGLIGDDVSLTQQQVGAMIELRDLPKISEAVGKAMENAMPAEDPNVKTPPAVSVVKKAAGTGDSSSTQEQ